jgi:hypothetical protein
MTSLKRALWATALVVVAASGTAYAEDPSPPLTPDSDQTPPPEACPGEATQACPPQPQPVQPAPTPPPQPVTTQPQPEEEPLPWVERWGVAISLGGGVDDFAGSGMRDLTSTGGSWNVRGTLGTRSYLAFEASYIGSAQSIDTLGLSNNTDLIGNGLQGDVRINGTTHYVVQPFIYSGGAWRHYDLSNNDFNTSDFGNSGDVFELPLGVGIATTYHHFMFDARGEYRWAWGGGDMFPDFDDNSLSLNRWNVSGNIGYEF